MASAAGVHTAPEFTSRESGQSRGWVPSVETILTKTPKLTEPGTEASKSLDVIIPEAGRGAGREHERRKKTLRKEK